MKDKLFLIDGHALIFKMYYAFLKRPMINSKGYDMSILFGFTKYLLELINKEQPTHIAVAFDPPGGTFRNKLYADYKANRSETPQLVIEALNPLTEICHALNIQTLMVAGYEADDVIGTVAKRFQSEEMVVYMVTPDKDYGQLVDKNIVQFKPGKAKENDEILDESAICEKYGIDSPLQVIEILTLCGDNADNVPGVKGIGEKNAQKLINKYRTVKNIYTHLNELTEKQKEMFEDASNYIELSHELVTIDINVPINISKDEMRLNTSYSPDIETIFENYEFNSLKKYIEIEKSVNSNRSNSPEINEVPFERFINIALKTKKCSIVTGSFDEDIFSDIADITFGAELDDKCYVSVAEPKEAKSILENADIAKCGINLKLQLNQLSESGIALNGKLMDLELMHYLINPEISHKPEALAKSYLDMELYCEEEDNQQMSIFDTNYHKNQHTNNKRTACIVYILCSKIEEDLNSASVSSLYNEIEEPLIRVLAKMERNGVKVDTHQLNSYASELRDEMISRENTIREMTGEPELNISSPKQVGIALFEKMQLNYKAKKNAKGNYSTDEETLSSISDKHPVINEILEFRAVKKLLSTYIEPFPSYISSKTGRIHTTFNQALTATGRLSSSNPNMQNIPIRSERGKEIRKAFIPGSSTGYIISADYSQIELRIMAHLCKDKHLIQAFNEGVDVHAATAAKIFGIDYNDVTAEQRRIAKTANFGIMYGISAFGLSQRLHIPSKDAKKLIDDYFAAFPSIKSFISETIEQAKSTGYVETIFGRRRYLPDINSKNAVVRSLAERNAVNAPIQGTAADIIKLAMISVDKKMTEAGFKSKMVLQIHDELLFDTIGTEVEALCKLIKDEMENVVSLRIPLTVECNYGKNWLEAH